MDWRQDSGGAGEIWAVRLSDPLATITTWFFVWNLAIVLFLLELTFTSQLFSLQGCVDMFIGLPRVTPVSVLAVDQNCNGGRPFGH